MNVRHNESIIQRLVNKFQETGFVKYRKHLTDQKVYVGTLRIISIVKSVAEEGSTSIARCSQAFIECLAYFK